MFVLHIIIAKNGSIIIIVWFRTSHCVLRMRNNHRVPRGGGYRHKVLGCDPVSHGCFVEVCASITDTERSKISCKISSTSISSISTSNATRQNADLRRRSLGGEVRLAAMFSASAVRRETERGYSANRRAVSSIEIYSILRAGHRPRL